DEVDSKLRRMAGVGVRDIITKLMLLLIAVYGERSNRGNKLIIAEGLKSGRCQSGCAERKCQPKSEVGISLLYMMEAAGLVHEVADPGRRKHKLIADQHAVIVRRGGESGGWQRAFMHQIILRVVAVGCGAHEPVRARRLGKVEARGEQSILERRAH